MDEHRDSLEAQQRARKRERARIAKARYQARNARLAREAAERAEQRAQAASPEIMKAILVRTLSNRKSMEGSE